MPNPPLPQGGPSKAGRPVFYLVLHNLRGDNSGFASKVLYHVMSTLHTFVDAAFELVLDVTAMQDCNMPDVSTCGGHSICWWWA